MNNQIDNDYISRAIDELVATLGIREQIPYRHFRKSLCGADGSRRCIKDIAERMGLPIEIDLSFVPKGYDPSAGARFDSRELVTTDQAGRGAGGIVAQVLIPPYLPPYGSVALGGFRIKVQVSENCAEGPYTFVCVMAHELAHIVLRGLWHKEKENEFYTDLTAMILGFSEVMSRGRRVTKETAGYGYTQRETTTYGYLSDGQFGFAEKKIRTMVGHRRREVDEVRLQLRSYRDLLLRLRRSLLRVKAGLQSLDESKRKVAKRDIQQVMLMHQPNYFHKYETALSFHLDRLAETEPVVERISNYSAEYMKHLSERARGLQSLHAALAKDVVDIANDESVLKRCMGFWARSRLWMSRLGIRAVPLFPGEKR